VAHIGFKVIWIEMEHAAISFYQAPDLCRMAAGTGMLTIIRIPDARRESVLKAAECGPIGSTSRMADSPEQVAKLVRYARFAPLGARGFFSVSRALKYGIVASVPEEQQKLNEELSLLAEIETTEALGQIEEIASISGVDVVQIRRAKLHCIVRRQHRLGIHAKDLISNTFIGNASRFTPESVVSSPAQNHFGVYISN
jgi:2-keto-3-deoxy-L-rhamnonate aldolase RhmA